jgi:hypothetical protein
MEGVISEDGYQATGNLKEVICYCTALEDPKPIHGDLSVYDNSSKLCFEFCRYYRASTKSCLYENYRFFTNDCTQDCTCDVQGVCSCDSGLNCLRTSIWIPGSSKRNVQENQLNNYVHLGNQGSSVPVSSLYITNNEDQPILIQLESKKDDQNANAGLTIKRFEWNSNSNIDVLWKIEENVQVYFSNSK